MSHHGRDRRMLSYVTQVALAGALAAASGCGRPSGSRLAVEWATPFSNLGYVLVDPPQEDIRVGDVFVYAANPEPRSTSAADEARSQKLGTRGRWVTLPVLGDVENQYQQRPEWPQTPIRATEAGDHSWSEATSTGQQGIFSPQPVPNRLRDVSLAWMSATISGQEEANAAVPTELFNLAPGTAFDDYKGITVSVGAAEMYALALDTVLTLLVDQDTTGEKPRWVLKEQYRRFLPLAALSDSDTVWVRVISEVVYMRSMDIVVQTAQAPEDVQDIPPPEMTSAKAPAPTIVLAPGEDPAVIPFQRAEEINRLLVAANNDRLPGGVSKILSVTDKSVSMRRIWARGLAVAARGLVLEVDKSTGVVRRLGAMGAPMPKSQQKSAPDNPDAEL
ncbi:MAG: hypothetical protein ACYTE6_10195 [Planctomycetota bacterium]